MSKHQYDFTIFLCRVQPYHLGHHKVIQRALEVSEKVIIVLGSDKSPRTIKNPFSSEERKNMIIHAFPETVSHRLVFIAQEDYLYSDTKWLTSVKSKIRTILWQKFNPNPIKVALIGHKKDSSSYYIDMFPEWDYIDVENGTDLNATDIRNEFFESGNFVEAIQNKVPQGTFQYLLRIYEQYGEVFDNLRKEYEFIKTYKKQWEHSPYPPTFVTCDATVIQSGHVLLVKRRAEPGKGLWAVPGGFLNVNERVVDGIIRELKEETKIKVPEAVLRGSMKTIQVFDHPERSMRGRTITHNGLIHLPNGPLPKVKGMDDAEKAKWFSLSDIDPSMFFEDHYSMVMILSDYLSDSK